jgi:cation transport ATPase
MSVALVSIWTGIGLSVVLMAIAMTGFIPAVAGALLQELVDLATILNGLRALHGADKKAGAGKKNGAVRQRVPGVLPPA